MRPNADQGSIRLDNQRRAALRRSQVRVREQKWNDVTAMEVHRRPTSQADPSPRRSGTADGADRLPKTRRHPGREDRPARQNEPTSR